MRKKILLVIFMVFLLLYLVSASWYSDFFGRITGKAVSIDSKICIDSDSGDNQFVKGMASTKDREYNDYCFNKYRQLKEYYCDRKDNLKERTYKCKNGCENGVCIECIDDAGCNEYEYCLNKICVNKTLMPVEYSKFWGILTHADLPNLLKAGEFNTTEGRTIWYIQDLLMGSGFRIQNSTSNGDLDSPTILIEVGTDYSNPLYIYRLTFSNDINFSEMHGKILEFLGENYIIDKNSTNQKIILNKKGTNSILILESNQHAKLNDKAINGTFIEFNGYQGNISRIDARFAMQNPKKDYIAVGEYYDDPFFQNIRVTFKSYFEGRAEIYIGSIKG